MVSSSNLVLFIVLIMDEIDSRDLIKYKCYSDLLTSR